MGYIVITNYLGDEPLIRRFDNIIDSEKHYAQELEEAEADKEKIRASSIVSVEILSAETIRKTVLK